MGNRNRSRPLGRSLPEKEEEEEKGGKKCLLSYLFHTCTDRRFDIHSIDEWKSTMAKSDRAPFQIGVSDIPQSHACSRRARVTSRLLPGPCKRSLDQWPAQWLPLLKSRQVRLGMKRNRAGTRFLNRGAAPWPLGGKRRHLLPWLRARAWRPRYWGASGSHAPAEAMSRILSGWGRSRTDSANSMAAFWEQNKNDSTWQFWRGEKEGGGTE